MPLSPPSIVGAALVLVLGVAIDFFGAMAIGLCAFWLEDTQPLALLYDRAIMLLGGLLLPLELFPEGIAAILSALPFQLLLYAPARLAVSGDLATLPTALGQLCLTLAAAFLVVRLVHGLALRRLHANGG